MLFEQKLASELEMQAFARRLSECLASPLFLALEGQLGAGKTTLVRSILRGLGYTGVVRSPTYTLLETYELPDLQIFHLDLYRLGDPQELEFLGIEEIFQTKALCLIEWPDKGHGFLPQPDLVCRILISGETQRCLQFESLSGRGEAVLVLLASMPAGLG